MRGASLGAARAPVRPSRRPPGLSPARAPQDEVNLWGHEEKPHAEEAAKPPSRSTQAGQLWYGPRLWPHLPVFAAIAPPQSTTPPVTLGLVPRAHSAAAPRLSRAVRSLFRAWRSEQHTSELQSLMRLSY